MQLVSYVVPFGAREKDRQRERLQLRTRQSLSGLAWLDSHAELMSDNCRGEGSGDVCMLFLLANFPRELSGGELMGRECGLGDEAYGGDYSAGVHIRNSFGDAYPPQWTVVRSPTNMFGVWPYVNPSSHSYLHLCTSITRMRCCPFRVRKNRLGDVTNKISLSVNSDLNGMSNATPAKKATKASTNTGIALSENLHLNTSDYLNATNNNSSNTSVSSNSSKSGENGGSASGTGSARRRSSVRSTPRAQTQRVSIAGRTRSRLSAVASTGTSVHVRDMR